MSPPSVMGRLLGGLGRLLWGLGALLVLLALVGGVPAVLWLYLGWPLPHALPTLAEFGRVLTQNGIPDTVLINILALGCWAAWAVFAASIVVETPAAVRGRTARRIPMAGPLQALASSLVAAVLLTFAPMTPRPHPQAGAPLPAALTVVEPTALARPDLGPSRAIPAEPPAATHRSATTAARPRRRGATPSSRATRCGASPSASLATPSAGTTSTGATRTGPSPTAASSPTRTSSGQAGPWSCRPALLRWGRPPVRRQPRRSLSRRYPPTSQASSRPRPRRGRPSRPVPASQPRRRAAGRSRQASQPALAVRVSSCRLGPWWGCRLPAGSPSRSPPPVSTNADGGAWANRDPASPTPTHWPPRPCSGCAAPPAPAAHQTPTAMPQTQAWTATQTWDRAEDADATISRAAPAPAAPTPPGPQAPVRPGVVAIGQHNDQEVTVDLTDGGLGLDGPTAPQAVRAVIVALLAAQPQADAVEVLVAGQPLAAQLLGDAAPTPGLGVVADLDTALSTVEVEMIHRLRLLQGHDAPDVASYLEVDPAEPLPTIVLVTDPADDKAGWAPRLAAVLAMGRRLSIGALLVGPIPGVATLTLGPNAEIQAVQPDIEGALRGLVGGCAFTLGQAEAAELLAVVAAGRGTHPDVPPEQSPPEPPGLPAAPPPQAQAKSEADRRATPEERPVRVRLFGPLRIELDGVEVRSGLRTTSRELLAFLLLHPDGVRRETATEALWPDMDPARSAGRAKDALRSLRQTLQDATGQPGATVVELIGDRLRVNPAFVDADVWRFQAALAAATATTDTQTKLDALTQAAAAYGGTLLEGADYDWAEAAREELRRQAADVAGRLGELRERAGDLDGAIAALEEGARWDAYNEELHQRIMRLQAQLGRLDAVRRTYVRLQERLADLGADPDEATERLLHELRRGTTTRR